MSDTRLGFKVDIGFIDHFNTQLVITLNYGTIVNLHTLQITTAYAVVSSPQCLQ
jgi:ethanolamine utilization microcompartment shell protein EutS